LLTPPSAGDGRQVEDAAVVVAEIEEEPLQLAHAAHLVEGGHVALQRLAEDVLAQEPPAARDVLLQRWLGEAAADEILVEVGGERGAGCGSAHEIPRPPVEEIAQRPDGGKRRPRHLAQQQMLAEREGRQRNGLDAPEPALARAVAQIGRRSGCRDPRAALQIDLMLDPGPPAFDELDLVDEDEARLVGVCRIELLPGADRALDAGELQDRVIEGRVDDVLWRIALIEQPLDALAQDGDLAGLTGAGQQQHAAGSGVLDPAPDLRCRGALPGRQVADGLAGPPGIELLEDGEQLGLRDVLA
jgi:hypothetical protein